MAALPAPGKLPKNIGLAALGFTPAMMAKLTPAAAKLTKADLIALQKWGDAGGKGRAPDSLTVQDLSSLTRAYGDPSKQIQLLKKKNPGGTSYCCCCSPCCTCTAAAEISPVRRL